MDEVHEVKAYEHEQIELLYQFSNLLVNVYERQQMEDVLQLYKRAVDQCGEGIAFTTMQGYVVFTNKTWAEMHGYMSDELKHQHLSIFHTEKQMQEDVNPALALLRENTVFSGDVHHRRKDGSEFLSDMTTTVVKSAGGQAVGLFAQMRDITEQKRLEASLRLAASVFSHASEGIIVTDAQANILDVNAAFSRITGYSREEVLQENPRILHSGKQDAGFYRNLWQQLVKQGEWRGEIWNKRKDGIVYPQMLMISAVKNKQGETTHYIGLMSDITVLKEKQEQLKRNAYYDLLTDLPNRLLLLDRLNRLMHLAQRHNTLIAVIFLDLDGFKHINDHYGHLVGDQFLIKIANSMKRVLRDEDTLARIGGDEFIVLLSDLPHRDEALPIVNRLLEAANMSFDIEGHLLQASASLGLDYYPSSNEDLTAEQLLRRADQAMYETKQAGKNGYTIFK